jgi:cephalosporin hydroxylase
MDQRLVQGIRQGRTKLLEMVGRKVGRLYHEELILRTGNFDTQTWLGQPIWQNVLDLWTIQETISEIRPSLLIEVGTNRGGSALFYAQLMDLLGEGRLLTVDIEKMHSLDHPRIEFLLGSSTSPEIVERMRRAAEETEGPVMVILDGNHERDHVAQELELYGPLVTPGSYILSQDGIIDQLLLFADSRPGPLPANAAFLARHPEFEHDRERNERFLVTHHPLGWLRRREG